jgi:hypothetical protein
MSNSAQGSLCAPSSSGSPRFATPFLVSLMPLLWLHFTRRYEMRKCWRSSLPTTSRMSQRCSAWQTSAPGPPRAVRGTPRQPQQARKRASPTPAPQLRVSARARRRRRLTVASRWPGHPPRQLSLQQRMGAEVAREATSAPANRPTVTRAVRSAGFKFKPR